MEAHVLKLHVTTLDSLRCHSLQGTLPWLRIVLLIADGAGSPVRSDRPR